MKNNTINTSCIGCAFAEVENNLFDYDLIKFKQKSCKLGIIDNENIKAVESIDKQGNEFFVIEGRLCPYYRNSFWLEKHTIERGSEESFLLARKEVEIKPTAIIIDNEGNIDEIIKTVASLMSGEIKPSKLFVVNNGGVKTREISNMIKEFGVEWRVETIFEENASCNRCMDIAAKKCKGSFLYFFLAGYTVPQDFFSSIDEKLHKKMERFVLKKPLGNDISGMVILREIYSLLRGNLSSSIVEKIEELAKEQSCQHLII
jgi:hypothetical protein